MDEDKDIFGEDNTEKNNEEDKTSKSKNEEGDEEEDKDKEEDKSKSSRSEIAQKIKYREQLREAKTRIAELEAKFAKSDEKPSDEAEAKAKAYIRGEAKAVFEELQTLRKADEERITRELNEKVEDILEENPEVTEKQLWDVIEEYEVEPKVALKILQKSSAAKPKPKMPKPKMGSDSEPEKKSDDSKKSMWQIAREEIAKLNK